jgi:hypothetical protein
MASMVSVTRSLARENITALESDRFLIEQLKAKPGRNKCSNEADEPQKAPRLYEAGYFTNSTADKRTKSQKKNRQAS